MGTWSPVSATKNKDTYIYFVSATHAYSYNQTTMDELEDLDQDQNVEDSGDSGPWVVVSISRPTTSTPPPSPQPPAKSQSQSYTPPIRILTDREQRLQAAAARNGYEYKSVAHPGYHSFNPHHSTSSDHQPVPDERAPVVYKNPRKSRFSGLDPDGQDKANPALAMLIRYEQDGDGGVKFTEDGRRAAMKEFCKAFAEKGTVRAGCVAASVSRFTAGYWLEHFPEFGKMLDEAREDYNDSLMEEVDRRARRGITRTKYFQYQGVVQDERHEQEYSDLLLMFQTKSRMPQYRDKAPDPGKDRAIDYSKINELLANVPDNYVPGQPSQSNVGSGGQPAPVYNATKTPTPAQSADQDVEPEPEFKYRWRDEKTNG